MKTYTIKTVDTDEDNSGWDLGNGRSVTITDREYDIDIRFLVFESTIEDGAKHDEIAKINCADDEEPFEPAFFINALELGELNGDYTVYSEAEWNAYVESCEVSGENDESDKHDPSNGA